jgi:hypothetical protein
LLLIHSGSVRTRLVQPIQNITGAAEGLTAMEAMLSVPVHSCILNF